MTHLVMADAPDRFALAGVSMGGMVALEIMRIASDRVTRLALIGTNARPDTPEQAERRRATNAAMLQADDLAALARPGIAYMIHPNAGEDVHAALLAVTLRVGVATCVRQNEAVLARADLRPVLAGVHVPTMIVVGADDLMTPPALSEELRDGITGAILHVIPDCGHLPPIEAPQALAALMVEWLKAP